MGGDCPSCVLGSFAHLVEVGGQDFGKCVLLQFCLSIDAYDLF